MPKEALCLLPTKLPLSNAAPASTYPPVHAEPPPPVEVPSTPTRGLDRSLIHGIAWTGIGRWLTQILSWIATPIVARLLSPDDYGVASMAMVFIGFVQLINQFGLGAAIIQRRDLSEDQIARIGGLSVLLGAEAAAVFQFLSATPLELAGAGPLDLLGWAVRLAVWALPYAVGGAFAGAAGGWLRSRALQRA